MITNYLGRVAKGTIFLLVLMVGLFLLFDKTPNIPGIVIGSLVASLIYYLPSIILKSAKSKTRSERLIEKLQNGKQLSLNGLKVLVATNMLSLDVLVKTYHNANEHETDEDIVNYYNKLMRVGGDVAFMAKEEMTLKDIKSGAKEFESFDVVIIL